LKSIRQKIGHLSLDTARKEGLQTSASGRQDEKKTSGLALQHHKEKKKKPCSPSLKWQGKKRNEPEKGPGRIQ